MSRRNSAETISPTSWVTIDNESIDRASTGDQEESATTLPYDQSKSTDQGELRKLLDELLDEQVQLLDHLQKRYDRFNKRAADEKARAKRERNRIKNNPPPKSVKQAHPAPATSIPATPSKMNVAKTIRGVSHIMDALMQASNAIASSSKSVRSASTRAKKRVNPDAMGLSEAVRVLRALEISNPSSSYSVTLNTRISKSTLPLRGRIALPTDARKTPETILVFCDPASPSANIAKSSGAAYVGGEELFPQVLSGEIQPTKVLATPGLMPAVQKSLARFLGPKGLMPAAKRGGVGEGSELAERIREAGGLMEWKADKLGVVRAPVAHMKFELPQVDANVRAFIGAVKDGSAAAAAQAAEATNSKKRQPSGIISARLETTNGPSIEINDVL